MSLIDSMSEWDLSQWWDILKVLYTVLVKKRSTSFSFANMAHRIKLNRLLKK